LRFPWWFSEHVTPCLLVSVSQHHVETSGNVNPRKLRHIPQDLSTQAERIIGKVERMTDEMESVTYEVECITDEVENISDEV
jgi:hypothetical protein